MHIILFEPEIPPNTGNIIRLAANTGAQLHLIEPLGFSPNDAQLKRAGLDYHLWAEVKKHGSWDAFQTYSQFEHPNTFGQLYAISTHGQQRYDAVSFQKNDAFLFGPETRGLPRHLLDAFPIQNTLRVPMQQHSRSLNLSNTVAILIYEALRQLDFPQMS